jgi:hypothetical protein
MTTAPILTVALDRPRQIAFTNLALFRMGSLPAPFDFEDIDKPRKAYSALVAWLWACLVPSDAKDFVAPGDLAQHVKPRREEMVELASRLADAINGATKAEKNDQSSTPGTSQPSS